MIDLFSFALGLSAGIGIGMIVLAAYHEHVQRAIKVYEEEWEYDPDALEAAFGNTIGTEGEVLTADHIINLSPEQWRQKNA